MALLKNIASKRVLKTLFRGGLRVTGTRKYSDTAEYDTESMFTPQHQEIRRSLEKLIESDINPYVDQWEKEGQFPNHEVFKKLGDGEFLGVNKPTEYGGLGLDYSYQMCVHESLGKINCAGIPVAACVQTDMSTPALAKFGSDELKRNFLAPTIAGDLVSCIAVSEPSAGSDVAKIETTAVKQGDDYIINGTKMWITNGIKGDWMCMLANTGEGPLHKNKSLIVVPLNLPGISTQRIDKMGLWCSDTAQIFMDDVRVPQSHRIGDEGLGFIYQMMQFQEERLAGVGISIEPLFQMIRDCIDYTSQRKIFGKPLLHNQVVHFRLAELETEAEALRSMLYRTVAKYIRGEDVIKYASMCKLKGGRLTREVSDSCLQYYGGMGFTNDVLISRCYRDGRLGSIGGGADEVMLSIICNFMETLPKGSLK